VAKCNYCNGLGCKVCKSLLLKEAEKKPKYGNSKTVIDNITFDSKNEAEFYEMLKLLKAGGKIKDFTLQPKFEIFQGFKRGDKKYQAINYVADFQIIHNDGQIEIVDVKTEGTITDVFKIKQKMFLAQFPYELSIMVKCPRQYGEGFISLEQLQEIRKQEKGAAANGKTKVKKTNKATKGRKKD